jgi:hypothetical protein
MVEREGGQWNVAIKEESVYLERVSKDEERLFEDLVEPHEARELARLLTKFADQLDESAGSDDSKKSRDSGDGDKEKDEGSDEDDESDDDDSDDDDDKKDKKSDSDD